VHSDSFDSDSLGAWWHFLTKGAAHKYSLSQRKGWVRLTPDTASAHLVQKETDHFYSAITRLELKGNSAKGGIYLTNGNQHIYARLFAQTAQEQAIVLQLDTAIRTVPYSKATSVWLKLIRNEHQLTGFYSADGKKWLPVGAPISAVPLDKVQPNYNSWVGTSVGLFAEGAAADFDCFVCKDGFSALPVIGSSNQYGTQQVNQSGDWLVTNTSIYGGWLMISGVDFGAPGEARSIELLATASRGGNVDIMIDDLKEGAVIASIPVRAGKDTQVQVLDKLSNKPSGQHDVFIRFPAGAAQDIYIKDIRLLRGR
jgi:xylan 1,4-beta-xylosidase